MSARTSSLSDRVASALASCVAGLLISLSVAVAAEPGMRPDLYRATVIVTGTDLRSRPAGFGRALLEVLVKVTGNPDLARDPRAAALAAGAGSLVASFDYFDPIAARRPHDDQGTYDRSYDLTVRFDRARVDRAIRKLGARPWLGPRPAIVPLVALRGADPPWVGSFLLTADGPAGTAQRLAFMNVASTYGVEVRLPTAAELEARGIRLDGPLPDRSAPNVDAISVVGALEFRPAALGWVGSWHTSWGSSAERWSTVSGVSFDEAFAAMVREAVTLAAGGGHAR